jgi:hypothetical protein
MQRNQRPTKNNQRPYPLPKDWPAGEWADPELVFGLETAIKRIPRFGHSPVGVINDWLTVVERVSQAALWELDRLIRTEQQKTYDLRPVIDRAIFVPSTDHRMIEPEWHALLLATLTYYHHQIKKQRSDMSRHMYFDAVGEVVTRLLAQFFPAGLTPYQVVDRVRTGFGSQGTDLLFRRIEAFMRGAGVPGEVGGALLQVLHRYSSQVTPWLNPELETAMNSLLLLIHSSPHPFDHVLIFDPNAQTGRGIMAVAQIFPRWAVNTGLIQFAGIEVNQLLLRICRLNSTWHGLKGVFQNPMDQDGKILMPTEPDLVVSDLGWYE